ncbi:transposase [Holospora elegans]|uniref:transposase n=1 Tax=Holospora elegans TaxID=431043 RepID=UPI000A0060E5
MSDQGSKAWSRCYYASFHKSKRSRELIEFVKCSTIFLLPYSPDLNLIQKFWANMKR